MSCGPNPITCVCEELEDGQGQCLTQRHSVWEASLHWNLGLLMVLPRLGNLFGLQCRLPFLISYVYKAMWSLFSVRLLVPWRQTARFVIDFGLPMMTCTQPAPSGGLIAWVGLHLLFWPLFWRTPRICVWHCPWLGCCTRYNSSHQKWPLSALYLSTSATSPSISFSSASISSSFLKSIPYSVSNSCRFFNQWSCTAYIKFVSVFYLTLELCGNSSHSDIKRKVYNYVYRVQKIQNNVIMNPGFLGPAMLKRAPALENLILLQRTCMQDNLIFLHGTSGLLQFSSLKFLY